MKKSYRWAVLAAAVLSLSVFHLAGRGPRAGPAVRGPSPPPGRQTIALLDVTYIFKNHARFKGRMEEMKADVQARREPASRPSSDRIDKIDRGAAKSYQQGNPRLQMPMEEDSPSARPTLERQGPVGRRKSSSSKRPRSTTTSTRKSRRRPTTICKQNGIDIVLQVQRRPVDVEQPDSVLTYINKPVVWYDDRLDITDR